MMVDSQSTWKPMTISAKKQTSHGTHIISTTCVTHHYQLICTETSFTPQLITQKLPLIFFNFQSQLYQIFIKDT
jgi:hypothetical protein